MLQSLRHHLCLHSDMMVEGSHVKARVIVKDIWCSNGVLHIVDDILHVAIRSIIEEMDRRPDIRYIVI